MNIKNVGNLSEKELAEIFPELEDLKGIIEINPWHDHDDVYVHVMAVLNKLKSNLSLSFVSDHVRREALLSYLNRQIDELTAAESLVIATTLHDIAKPETYQNNGTSTSCPNHEALGAEKTKGMLEKAGFSQKDADFITLIVLHHGDPHGILSPKESPEILQENLDKLEANNPSIFLELLLLGLSDTEGSQLVTLIPDEFEFRVQKYYDIISNYSIPAPASLPL